MTTLKRPIWFLFHEQLLSNTNTKARLRQIDEPPLTSNWQRPILLKRQPFCNTDVFPVKYNTSTNTNVLTAKTVVISILWPRLKYKKRSFKTVFVNDIDDINDINDVNHFVIWNTIKDTLLDPDINDINDVNHFVNVFVKFKFKFLNWNTIKDTLLDPDITDINHFVNVFVKFKFLNWNTTKDTLLDPDLVNDIPDVNGHFEDDFENDFLPLFRANLRPSFVDSFVVNGRPMSISTTKTKMNSNTSSNTSTNTSMNTNTNQSMKTKTHKLLRPPSKNTEGGGGAP